MGKTIYTRIGAILTALAAIPFGLGTFAEQLHRQIHMPDWLYIVCFSGGIIGPVIIGFGSSGNISQDQIKQVVSDHLAAQQGVNPAQGGPQIAQAGQEKA
jgi:hypothetical protein